MTIRDDGFFSPDMPQWVAKNRAENAEWFALADRLRRLSQRPILAAKLQAGANEYTMHLMFLRAVTSYQAALLLAERGMPADAQTVARSMLETTMFFGACTNNPKFYERLVAADRQHKVRVAKPLISMGMDATGLSADQVARLEAFLADPAAPEPGSIPLDQLMKEMGLGSIYDTYYRGLSGGAAHPTVQSLDRHAAVDGSGDATDARWGPDLRETRHTLMTICSIMFYLLRWFSDTLGAGQDAGPIDEAWAEYKSLAERQPG